MYVYVFKSKEIPILGPHSNVLEENTGMVLEAYLEHGRNTLNTDPLNVRNNDNTYPNNCIKKTN